MEIEQCEDEGVQCNTDEDAPFTRSTVCRQKYTTHKLYAMTANKEQIYDSFSLPSACLCYFKTQFRAKSNVGLRSSFKASRPSGPRLPFCREGAKLNLPKFVSSFPSAPSQSTGENFSRRTSSAGRPFVYPDRQQSRVSRDFVYPGRVQETFSRWQRDTVMSRSRRMNRRRNSAPSCVTSGKRYCVDTNTNNYPADLARNLLAKNPAVGETLFRQVFDNKCTNTIATRFFSVEDEQLCRGRQKVIFPRTALNLNNEWRYVVNIDNFTQAVEIEGDNREVCQ